MMYSSRMDLLTRSVHLTFDPKGLTICNLAAQPLGRRLYLTELFLVCYFPLLPFGFGLTRCFSYFELSNIGHPDLVRRSTVALL